MDQHNTKDFEALGTIVDALKNLEPEGQRRVLMTVATFLNLHLTDQPETRHHAPTRPHAPSASTTQSLAPFSENRDQSPKEFLRDKQPRSDVERVACLAFYLTHYRDTPHFKTIDISAINTEAAQPKFSNASMAVDNTAKAGLLVAAVRGTKQLSSVGEIFVQQLPDRDAAKAAVASMKPRKRPRRPIRKSGILSEQVTSPGEGENEALDGPENSDLT